ncbi:hypothetical protein GPECTOR_13g666 [Gonium pectorale]|uniref:Uncharacterized protein n=1 Tax=Gonium pectorale TaxID=33097 RepID=A0A150GMX5_GONPE|nr:hypothetical protein GPECTOR_13g666 [Gonium pectorale]|eukprot:KXZ51179.1 hypothetical protein GPECTOR_13g666 [Gonium pectorale]
MRGGAGGGGAQARPAGPVAEALQPPPPPAAPATEDDVAKLSAARPDGADAGTAVAVFIAPCRQRTGTSRVASLPRLASFLAAATGGGGGALGALQADAAAPRQEVEASLLRPLLAVVLAMTAHLTAMLAQLLAAGREVEDMAALVSGLVSAAQSSWPNRSAMRSAMREAAERHLAPLGDAPVATGSGGTGGVTVEPPSLPSPLDMAVKDDPSGAEPPERHGAMWQRLSSRVQAVVAVAALAATRAPLRARAAAQASLRREAPGGIINRFNTMQRERARALQELDEALGGALTRQPSLRRLAEEIMAQEAEAVRAMAVAAAAGSAGEGAGVGPGAGGGLLRAATLVTRQRRGWGVRRRAMAAAASRQAEQQGQREAGAEGPDQDDSLSVCNAMLFAGNVAAGGLPVVEPSHKTESTAFSAQLRRLRGLGVPVPYEALAEANGDMDTFCTLMDEVLATRSDELVPPPNLEALDKAVREALLFVTPQTRALGKAESNACDVLLDYEERVRPILEAALTKAR